VVRFETRRHRPGPGHRPVRGARRLRDRSGRCAPRTAVPTRCGCCASSSPAPAPPPPTASARTCWTRWARS
jgi:hypothetical protein